MSRNKNDSIESIKNKEYFPKQIAKILREAYESSNSSIKLIAFYTKTSQFTVRNWYNATREPAIGNFIYLAKVSPRLIEWFLNQVGKEDLAYLLKRQNQNKSSIKKHSLYFKYLIFETVAKKHDLIKMQKLTLRQLWFYTGIKDGEELNHHDLMKNFGVSRATAYRDISRLRKFGLI